MLLFALMDRKAGAFLRPAPAQTEAEAVRSVTLAVRQGDNNLAQFSEDFALYEVGSFDAAEGRITPTFPPRHVVNVSSLKVVSNG